MHFAPVFTWQKFCCFTRFSRMAGPQPLGCFSWNIKLLTIKLCQGCQKMQTKYVEFQNKFRHLGFSDGHKLVCCGIHRFCKTNF
jgi:hypothetical protein